MPAILRNDDAEALILDIRTARNASTQDVAVPAGAFLLFPTSVVTPGATSGQLVFPLRWSAEPGDLVTGAGTAEVAGSVAGVTVSGAFHWCLGDRPGTAESYRFRCRGRQVAAPRWAEQLPSSQALAATGAAALARQQSRLRRRGHDAEHWLLTLSERVIRHACRGRLHCALRYRPPTDVDDLVQRSLQAACRLLPLYASDERPPCSWLGMLRLDGRRDLYREVSRLDWLPADAVAALSLADACGIDRHGQPAATCRAIVDAAEWLGRPPPRIQPAQLAAAVRAPALLEQDALARALVPGPDNHDYDAGQVAATVARLVSEDPQLIALAGAGDTRALDRIGAQVVRSLSVAPTSTRRARDEAWEQFRQSGQLFTTPIGRERFASVADPVTLTAIDDCLRRAARVRPVVTTG